MSENQDKAFNPWPYGLATVLVLFCVIQFSLVALASTSFEGLDDVEYYRHGIEYGEEMARQRRQEDLGWIIDHNLEKALTPDTKYPFRVALLDSDQKPIMKAKVKMKVGRPATLRDDANYQLEEIGPGIYAAEVNLARGAWKFELEAEKGENLVKVQFRHAVEGSSTEPVALGS